MSDSSTSQARTGTGLRLAVIIPALNEEITVGTVIERIPRDLQGVVRVDVIVVDDGSTDRTVEVATAAGARVISHGRCRGVGAAFQTGLATALASGADLVVNIDADGQFDPATIRQLVAPVVDGQADFATASRFKDPDLVPEMTPVKLWGNRMMSRLISGLVKQRFYDVSCGMRCYNLEAALRINVVGEFTYTQEVFLNLAHKRMRMAEVPIKVRGTREHGKSRVASNIPKYAVKTSSIILRSYRDYQPLKFFGTLAGILFVPGFCLELFLLVHYVLSGALSPHKWAGFVGLGLGIIALLLLMMGFLGDMLNRHRLYLEEALLLLRRQQLAAQRLQDSSPGAPR